MARWDEQSVLSELFTVQDFVRFGASQFSAAQLHYGHGTNNSVDDALQLVCSAINLTPPIPPEFLSARMTNAEKRAVLGLISRRIEERVPVPYLAHRAYFAGLEFYVDERVLIPRSPIAELIEQSFEPWIDPFDVHQVLDLCTGSGCIAIACALAFPDAAIVGSDVSADALVVAQKNVARHNLSGVVSLVQSDLFDDIAPQRFQIIVSNPPYVGDEELASLPKEFAHEPQLGLQSADDGLAHAKRILRDARRYLSDDGILVVEVGNSQYALQDAYPDVPFTWLEFTRGGDGVFLLRAEDLDRYAKVFVI